MALVGDILRNLIR